jgi:hypothetical protein
MNLTPSELATVLAGLRLLQDNLHRLKVLGLSEHFTGCEPPTAAQIDDLCERLNQ